MGERSLKVTGAGAVDGIDRTIWREESRCGFQSRRHEREMIPSSTPHHRTARHCRTHFYSPVRLWGREGRSLRGGASTLKDSLTPHFPPPLLHPRFPLCALRIRNDEVRSQIGPRRTDRWRWWENADSRLCPPPATVHCMLLGRWGGVG